MDEVTWIKLYIDMFYRRKINKIRRLPAGNDIILFWVMLLATAGKCNAEGMIFITEKIPFTKEDFADEFDFELSTIELALKAFVEFDMIDIYEDGFISVRNWAKYQNTDKLDNWCEFINVIKNLEELEIKSYVDKAIRSRLEPRYIVSSFKKAFYMQWIDAVMHESPLLMALCRVPHDETVRKFKEKDELNFEINKALIKARLSEKRPETDMITQGSEISVLLREGEKKRKQKSIRALLSEVSELALTLKPCFLMSPLSVSTYLSADMTFDVVIFDEASQIFPEDAIGAICRGSQVIIAGDSKQLPPTDFFASATNGSDADYDRPDEEALDVVSDSILEEAASVLPNRTLLWHYRSRHESLIAFSNREIVMNAYETAVKEEYRFFSFGDAMFIH